MAKREKVRYGKDIHFVIHGEVMRPWGFEVRVAIFNDNEEHIDSACITFPRNDGQPLEKKIIQRVVKSLDRHKHKRDNPEPPEPEELVKVISADNIVQFMVDRGYLVDGQDLNDLPDLTPGTVETPRWRAVWNFLNKPLWGG